MPDQSQEILWLQALVAKQRAKLDLREAEWRLQSLPSGGADESGTNNTVATVRSMDTSMAQRVADDLLGAGSWATTGGLGAGRPGDALLVHDNFRQQQQDQLPGE